MSHLSSRIGEKKYGLPGVQDEDNFALPPFKKQKEAQPDEDAPMAAPMSMSPRMCSSDSEPVPKARLFSTQLSLHTYHFCTSQVGSMTTEANTLLSLAMTGHSSLENLQ